MAVSFQCMTKFTTNKKKKKRVGKKNSTSELIYRTKRHRCRKQIYGYQWGEMERDNLGDWNWHIDNWSFAVQWS